MRLRRPSKNARLGRPVRLSWLAWWARLSFSLCRWLCQDSSSSSKALKSLPSSLSSAICAGGTRRSKLRSRRAAWATLARLRSGPTISPNIRRDRYSALKALSAVHSRIPARPLSRKRTRLPPCPTSSMRPTCWPWCSTGRMIGSSSRLRTISCSACASKPLSLRCQRANSSPLSSKTLASATSSAAAISASASLAAPASLNTTAASTV
ncbi:hypothetical protein D3C79_759110 [compost metagenome]